MHSRKPYDAENSKAPVEESQNKQDQSGDSNASGWDGRPKYKSDTTVSTPSMILLTDVCLAQRS
jgi:hypothetical protein